MKMNPTLDPAESGYQPIATKLKSLSWEEFEILTASLVAEIGFCDVHRLTRGSQQGKDIIGTWESRFVLGHRVPFRFQCKHKQKASFYLKKKDLGDSLTDFLLQSRDEVLVIVTNGQLSNDLIDQMDNAADKGVYAICQNQLIRLITSCPETAEAFLGLTPDLCESTRQFFEVRDWIEAICSNATSSDFKVTLHRFWTEPYTWFFHQDTTRRLHREWTTSGGEFRLSCQNSSLEIQDVSGLTLTLIDRKPLPEFAIINTTPKGGQSLKRVNINLSDNLGSFDLSPDDAYLAPGESYNCLIDFRPVDPGIYTFQVRWEGGGGSKRIRESDIYTIISLPDPLPASYVNLLEAWPQSLIIIETLFSMSPEERLEKFGSQGSDLFLFRKESGELVIKYCRKTATECFVSNMKEILVDHPLANILFTRGNSETIVRYHHLLDCKYWVDEWLDRSEPRAPLSRAESLQTNGADVRLIQDALLKAHERAPWHPKLNTTYAAIYYSLGYRGYAQFYMGLAYTASPNNPIVAGMHCLLQTALRKHPVQSTYTKSLDSMAEQGFLRIISLANTGVTSFPKSYWGAARVAFPDNPKMQDVWTGQCW